MKFVHPILSLLLLLAGSVGYCAEAPTCQLAIVPDGMTRSGIAYEVLTDATVSGGSGKRKDNWHENREQSPEWRATEEDYYHRVFDKGHLGAAGNQSYQGWIDRTFDLANCAPQHPALNRGLWNQIESQVRGMVRKDSTVYVATMGLYLPDETGTITISTIGKHSVWVPTHFAKAVLLIEPERNPSMIAWIVPNHEPPDGAKPHEYKATVDEIEFGRGVDLFSWLTEAEQKRMESTK